MSSSATKPRKGRARLKAKLAAWFLSRAILAQTIVTQWLGGQIFRRRGLPAVQKPCAESGIDFAQVKSVLIVRLDEIGDMVMFSPFLRHLRLHLPDARITLVVKPGVRNLVEFCPFVDEVLTFDQRGSRAARFLSLPLRAYRFASERLWRQRFDLAILPRWDADYYYAAYVAFWSGARRRIGYSETVTDYKQVVNRGFDRLLTTPLQDRRVKHDVEHNGTILRFLGIAADNDQEEVWPTAQDRKDAETLLSEAGIRSDDLVIGIGPSGGHSVLKQWPLEHFAALGRRLQQKYDAWIVLIGGPDEADLGEKLARELGSRVSNLVGKTTLRQMAAVMERCHVYVGNDSGPTHVAAATGIPVVALFGSSCPHRFHPGGRTAILWRDLPCGPCAATGHVLNRCKSCIYDRPRCLTEISPEDVERAVARCLDGQTPRLTFTAQELMHD